MSNMSVASVSTVEIDTNDDMFKEYITYDRELLSHQLEENRMKSLQYQVDLKKFQDTIETERAYIQHAVEQDTSVIRLKAQEELLIKEQLLKKDAKDEAMAKGRQHHIRQLEAEEKQEIEKVKNKYRARREALMENIDNKAEKFCTNQTRALNAVETKLKSIQAQIQTTKKVLEMKHERGKSKPQVKAEIDAQRIQRKIDLIQRRMDIMKSIMDMKNGVKVVMKSVEKQVTEEPSFDDAGYCVSCGEYAVEDRYDHAIGCKWFIKPTDWCELCKCRKGGAWEQHHNGRHPIVLEAMGKPESSKSSVATPPPAQKVPPVLKKKSLVNPVPVNAKSTPKNTLVKKAPSVDAVRLALMEEEAKWARQKARMMKGGHSLSDDESSDDEESYKADVDDGQCPECWFRGNKHSPACPTMRESSEEEWDEDEE